MKDNKRQTLAIQKHVTGYTITPVFETVQYARTITRT